MKFLQRWKQLSRHKESYERGRLWDNMNSPGTVHPPQTTISTSNSVQARTQAFTPGPNVEPYLQTRETKDPFRHSASFNQLQPRIAVKEPWAVSSTYIQNNNIGQTGLPQTSDVNKGAYVAKIKALSPPMTRQRDNLYDAASFRNLQRFQFAYTESQRHFNERTPIYDFVAPSYFSNQVTTNEYPLRPGWSQAYVPETGMRRDTVGASPAYLLSTPLNVRTIIEDNYKAPVTHAKSPKRKRTGG